MTPRRHARYADVAGWCADAPVRIPGCTDAPIRSGRCVPVRSGRCADVLVRIPLGTHP